MSQSCSYQLAVAAFHSAIDCEQANKNEEAYKKYAEGLSLVSITLKNEVDSLNQPNVVNIHKQMLEYAKKSVDRLHELLEKLGSDRNASKHDTANKHDTDDEGSSLYQKMSNNLPEIVTNRPVVGMSFTDEVPGYFSPLSSLEEDKQRIIRNYESLINSLMDVQAKGNLRLELERRLAENDVLAQKRFDDWEKRRKTLTEECLQIAEQKFYIQEKIKTGVVNDSDFTKQNLYAACLQYHKEHRWAQEASCKIHDSVTATDENYIRQIIGFILQHKSHPLACMLRQVQQKVLSKLTKLHVNQVTFTKNELIILQEHLKNITQDIKEDLFILTTVIQALWESLVSEKIQLIIIDTLHHLYFPAIKPHLIQLFRITLSHQEERLKKYSEEYAQHAAVNNSFNLHPVISKLHQLPRMHSPSSMMSFLVEILRLFVNYSCNKEPTDNSVSLANGIDDIMPKLIELVVVSNLSSLPAEITFVENFMPAKKALGEEGYAVTLMQSILSYICNSSTSLNLS